jgi:DNA-3-methyladenine glycosylase II
MSESFATSLTIATEQLRQNDPILATVIDQVGPCRLRPHGDYYRELVDSIISQQLSIKAAATILKRFAGLGKSEFPTPEEVAALSIEELRAPGLSNAKAHYVQDLAQHVLDRRLDLKRIAELPNEEIIVELTDVKGIGEWTAHMFLIFSVGRLDVLPTGDLGVRKGVQLLYKLSELPTPVQMQAIATRNGWGGAESVAAWYVWRSLDMKPFEH